MQSLGVMQDKSSSLRLRLHYQNLLSSSTPIAGVAVNGDCQTSWAATGKGLQLCQGQWFLLCSTNSSHLSHAVEKPLSFNSFSFPLRSKSCSWCIEEKRAIQAQFFTSNFVGCDSMSGDHSQPSRKKVHNTEKTRKMLFRICSAA